MKSFDMVFWKEIEEQFELGLDDPNPEFVADIEELIKAAKSTQRCIACLNYQCSCKEGHAERINK